MLYPYKYLPHKIERLHGLVEHFFTHLFEERSAIFDENILIPANFKVVYKACRKTLKKPLQDIFAEFQNLKPEEKSRLKEGYEQNNAIQELCCGQHNPLTYNEIPEKMQELLKNFFNGLWEQVLEVGSVQEICGTKMEHYKDFVDRGFQKAVICPFCGLEGLKGPDDDVRDPYDHYIAKAIYPFTSVNFKNLVPACKSCNSDYKKACDTFNLAVNREKAFYPFDANLAVNIVSIRIVCHEGYDLNSLTFLSSKLNWEIEFHDTANHTEELATWERVYRLKSRYIARIKHRENIWWDYLKDQFKEHQQANFEDFKNSMLRVFNDVRFRENDILQKAYYEYLFSNPALEKLLEDTVRVK